MQIKLTGKNAIVTGSTSGIGEGIARALAEAGANVLFNGFGDQKEIDALLKEVADKYKVKTAFSGDDLSKPEGVAAMVKKAEDAFGQVDILVNNAGIQFTALIEDFPIDKWNAIIAINLSAAFHATRLVIKGMKVRKWGRIINTCSAHGLVASGNKSAYVAAKHGIMGLTKVAALEAAGTGVTCNAINPGYVLTPLVQKQIDDRAKKENVSVDEAEHNLLDEKQPSKKFATVEQIGGIATFLCSSYADQITGAPISVDGGWVAQ